MCYESEQTVIVRKPISCLGAVVSALLLINFSAYGNDEFIISPDERPVQYEEPQVGTALIETTGFIHAADARNRFNVSGDGLAVAILDTGLRTTHFDFLDRIPTVQNFTADDGGDKSTVTDLCGHGTHVAGIIAAKGHHTGIAPRASLIPLKVLRNDCGGSYTALLDALNWVIDNHSKFGITVVNLSLGDKKNLVSDESFSNNEVRLKIASLRAANVPVVVAAGNNYYNFKTQGMGFPAILRETVSVGAVYDSEFPHGIDHKNGAISYKAIAGQITPFSQRLHASINNSCATDIFAPGATVTSSGNLTDYGESSQNGTSQASPVIAGVILLLQEYYRKQTNKLPTVDQIESWLKTGGVEISDRDLKADNVPHTNANFLHVDVVRAIGAANRSIELGKH